MAVNNDHARGRCCYLNWMDQQEKELEELRTAFNEHSEDDEKLNLLSEITLKNFQDYQENRNSLALKDPSSFFSPSWCSSLENSYFWIAGCRPTLGIRLVYAVCGIEHEAQLDEFLQGVSRGNLGELSASQLNMISELQLKTINKEEILTSRMTSMQEDMADQPLAGIAYESRTVGESSQHVDRAIDDHALALVSIMEDADKLRVNTLKELINILTPLQAVDLLLAAKKLHLSIHEWGKNRDLLHAKEDKQEIRSKWTII